jgi:hypothetical protein
MPFWLSVGRALIGPAENILYLRDTVYSVARTAIDYGTCVATTECIIYNRVLDSN